MILLIDNYDSFTFNLYQYIGIFADDIKVVRNDKITIEEIQKLQPERIVLSPGPKSPAEAGICMDVVKELGSEIPLLGVCLGHQAICTAFGATVTYAKELMHGKQSTTNLDRNCPIFADCPERAPVARYHSLAAIEETMPDVLQVSACTEDGEIMAVRHRDYDIYGLQFHPESILTPEGKTIVENFLKGDK